MFIISLVKTYTSSIAITHTLGNKGLAACRYFKLIKRKFLTIMQTIILKLFHCTDFVI